MGNKTSFPITEKPISYKKVHEYDASGEKSGALGQMEENQFERAASELFHTVMISRKELQVAKKKFRDFNADDMKKLFPKWKSGQLMEFKSQFLMFDLNQDGLIDFDELNEVLLDMGDTSEEEVRRRYFADFDNDGSGKIDFEEFLNLVYRVQFLATNSFGDMCKKTAEESRCVKRLSIVQQMHHGIF